MEVLWYYGFVIKAHADYLKKPVMNRLDFMAEKLPHFSFWAHRDPPL